MQLLTAEVPNPDNKEGPTVFVNLSPKSPTKNDTLDWIEEIPGLDYSAPPESQGQSSTQPETRKTPARSSNPERKPVMPKPIPADSLGLPPVPHLPSDPIQPFRPIP